MNHRVMPLCVPVAPAQVEGGSELRSADKTPLGAVESGGEGAELPKVWVLSAGTTEATFMLCVSLAHTPALWHFRQPYTLGFFQASSSVRVHGDIWGCDQQMHAAQSEGGKKSSWLVCWFPSHVMSQRAELGWVPVCRQGGGICLSWPQRGGRPADKHRGWEDRILPAVGEQVEVHTTTHRHARVSP